MNDLVGAGVFFAIGVIGLLYSYHITRGTISNPGAGFLPFYLSLILVLLSLLLFFKSFKFQRGGNNERIKIATRWKRLISAFVGLLLYACVIQRVGFVISSFLILILLLRFVEERSWRLTLLLSLVFPCVFYFFSVTYLQIPLPKGILPF
jgi:putative tricarboxylic transport membrane protein